MIDCRNLRAMRHEVISGQATSLILARIVLAAVSTVSYCRKAAIKKGRTTSQDVVSLTIYYK